MNNYNYLYTYLNIKYKYYFLLTNTLIKPYDKNDKQHIIDKAHGMIDIFKNKGDISSSISVIFIYILINLILGYFLIKG